jgi:bacterioferritin-associated ferredoxin
MLFRMERSREGVFACICRAVTRDEVSTAIDDGAATVAAVSRATGACTGCGICRDRIRTMLREHADSCARQPLTAA